MSRQILPPLRCGFCKTFGFKHRMQRPVVFRKRGGSRASRLRNQPAPAVHQQHIRTVVGYNIVQIRRQTRFVDIGQKHAIAPVTVYGKRYITGSTSRCVMNISSFCTSPQIT